MPAKIHNYTAVIFWVKNKSILSGNFLLLFISLLSIFLSCQDNNQSISIDNLKCEYLSSPLGIDSPNPRLSWQLKSDEGGVNQQAYQLFVGTDSVEVSKGTGNQWESGSIQTETIPVIYNGPALKAFTRYYWAVKVKDNNGWTPVSIPSWFDTGMMDQKNWKGSWISDTYDYKLRPAALFRKSIRVEKTVKSAKVYIAVGGLYELSLNGDKVGNHVLDPMFTRYDRRTLYVTYDVTNQLRAGENVLGVQLGNGWYNHQPNTVWYFNKSPWRARPKFCLDLRISYIDGTEETICTDTSWKTFLSPVTSNNIYTGEHYDARLNQEGWDKPGFDSSNWKKVLPTGTPSKNIISQTLHPIRDVETLPAKEIKKLNSKTYVFNFGRNISGTSQLTISGKEGTIVKLVHAERIDDKGHADISKITHHYITEDDSDPMQTDIVVLSGGEDHFRSKFTYKGFQYVEVSADKPISLTQNSLEAFFIHSDLPKAGSINSSNKLINKIWEAGNASYLSNMLGYPTDCPTREKNGWTGDAHIAVETGLYNFDGITLYEKWMADHRDEQQANGVLPAIIPTSGWGYQWGNGVDWTSTVAIIPWNVYLFYGDTKILEDNYENIKRYVDHLTGMAPEGLINWGLGDWASWWERPAVEFTSSVYYYADALILSKAAEILNKEEDYQRYTTISETIKKAINEKYLDQETGTYGKGTQTEMAMAIYWGIVPDTLKEQVSKKLAELVKANDNHLQCGILGAKAILCALSENGYADLAYAIATQKTYPSWGYWLANGATSFYESWQLGRSSLNHIMFGEVSAWFYKSLGGMYPDETSPGFKNIILKPNFVKGLDHFEARHESPYGEIISSWKREDGKINYEITVPPNSIAELHFDKDNVEIGDNNQLNQKGLEKSEIASCSVYKLKSGSYSFCVSDL